LIGKLGLAMAVAVAAAACSAPSAAGLESTTLCQIGTEGVCPESKAVKFEVVEAEDPVFLTSVGNVLCEGALLALGLEPGTAPEVMNVVESQWFGCKFGGSACTIEDLEIERLELQRTVYNLGTVTWVGHEAEIVCNLGFKCKYGGEFVLQAEGANHTGAANFGRFIANETPIAKTGGGILCPKEVRLDASFGLTLEGVFIPR